MPAPFNTADISRCERLNQQLKDSKFSMRPVRYYTAGAVGKEMDVPEDSKRRETSLKELVLSVEDPVKKPASCMIHGTNQELQDSLAANKKMGGHEASVFEIWLNKNEVHSTDIPVNLASCNDDVEIRTGDVGALAFMPKNCNLIGIHAHNGNDKNAAFHLHIKCRDVEDVTLNWLRALIRNANDVGNDLCTGAGKNVGAKIKDVKKYEKCLNDCYKSKTKQTRFEVMGGGF